MSTVTDLESALAQFCGSENFYRHWLGRFLYTDGVQYLADNAGGGAYWLIDLIASWQTKAKVRREPFQVWTLKVNRDKHPMAVAEAWDDIPGKLLASQRIEYTDFPLDEIKLYLENGVLMLPGER